jgi:hypothetical protein
MPLTDLFQNRGDAFVVDAFADVLAQDLLLGLVQNFDGVYVRLQFVDFVDFRSFERAPCSRWHQTRRDVFPTIAKCAPVGDEFARVSLVVGVLNRGCECSGVKRPNVLDLWPSLARCAVFGYAVHRLTTAKRMVVVGAPAQRAFDHPQKLSSSLFATHGAPHFFPKTHTILPVLKPET